MGFEEYFSQDHCYHEEASVNEIGMNVIINDCPNQEKPNTSCTEQNIHQDTKPYLIIKNGDNTNITNAPVDNCTDHSDLFLHEDEKLVKLGDKFNCHNDFVQYLNENAKRWCFYYSCSDSRKPNTRLETYTYNCVYLKTKEKYAKKGLRRRSNNLKTDCPCKIKLRHLPNEKELTVVFVCNHHDHPLSEHQFYKLQHGRRLPPYVKEEIMDLLSLQVDTERIRQYVQIETGYSMSRQFFYGVERTMRLRNIERHISEARLKQLSEKIGNLDDMYHTKHEDTEERLIQNEGIGDQSGPFNTTNHRIMNKSIKRSPVKRRLKTPKSTDDKRIKLDVSQNVISDSDTLQYVMKLQESATCETMRNAWIMEQAALPHNMLITSEDDGSVCVNIIDEGTVNDNIEAVTYTNVQYVYDYCDQSTANENAHEVTVSEMNDSIRAEHNESCIAYETVTTEALNEEDNETIFNVNDQSAMYHYERHDNEISGVSTDCNDKEQFDTEEIIEYVNSDGEVIDYSPEDDNEDNSGIHNDSEYNGKSADNVNLIGKCASEEEIMFAPESSIEALACDAAVQTCDKLNAPTLPFVPVFDVYMKDGNVTGFVLNNEVMQNTKQVGTEKSVQTEKTRNSEIQPAEDTAQETIDTETSICIDRSSHDTFTKHEYIHKYNLEQYMVLPHFPKYIETLAKQTNTDVLKMFTNIYKEKALFKMTTTQRGKEGNTTIWYVTETRIRRRNKGVDPKKREQLGRNLKDVLLLKDKVRTLKKQNYELATRNKYLEDVALRLVNLG